MELRNLTKTQYEIIRGLVDSELSNTEFGLDIENFISRFDKKEKKENLLEYIDFCKLAYKLKIIEKENLNERLLEAKNLLNEVE